MPRRACTNNGDGFVQQLDLGTVAKELVVPEDRIIDGNDAAFRMQYDSQWRDVVFPEDSTIRLRWTTDTSRETASWVFGLDNVVLQLSNEGDGIRGDFERDGLLDVADLDALNAEIQAGTNDPYFDLDGNTFVDSADRSVWVTDISAPKRQTATVLKLDYISLKSHLDRHNADQHNSDVAKATFVELPAPTMSPLPECVIEF